jgi:hypothetical protein
MPDPIQPQPTPVAVETPQPQPVAPAPEAPQTPRQEVYAKYEQLYGNPLANQPAPPETPVPVEPTPIPAPAPPVAAPPDEFQATIKALQDKIAQLEGRIPAPPPPPTSPPPVSFVDKLREGDFEGAEALLINKTREAVTAEATQKAFTEAVEAIRVQNEIESYVARLRAENPDVVPFERYLNAPVQARLEAAKNSGKVQSAADFVREYKAAVDAEVAELRKISQQYRAAGKSEAMVTKREVLSATTLQPQLVSPERTGQQEEPQVETPQDYLAERLARLARMKGLAA